MVSVYGDKFNNVEMGFNDIVFIPFTNDKTKSLFISIHGSINKYEVVDLELE